MQYTEYTIGLFSEWSQSFRTSIDALSFGGHENHNYNICWLGNSAKTIKQRRPVAPETQPTVPPQTDSTHDRSYTTYSTHNISSTGLLLHKRGPTRSCYVWHRQPIQHEAFLLDTARDDSAQSPIHHKPIPHVPDSTQPVSTHQFFSTKLVMHHCSPFLHTNISQVGKVGRRYGLRTRFP